MDLLRPLTETFYPPINHYGPVNHLYGPPQDLLHPLRTTLYYTVWQILESKSAKAKRSGAKESTLRLQMTSITILNSKSLNTDITILQMTTYGNSTKKTLQTLQKPSLRPVNS